jgi:hypothetical protein
MTITKLMMAEACANLYAQATGWDHYWELDDVVVAHQRIDDTDLVILRGSITAGDWVRDALAIPVWHDQLGFVHAGFMAGMDDVFAEVRKVVGPKVVITGHSLGGARARILAALFAVNGLPAGVLHTFGSPKPGFKNLARILQKSGWTHSSDRNRNDIVPTLPMILDWQHTEPWTPVSAAPAQDDLEPLRDHSIALYVQAHALTSTSQT